VELGKINFPLLNMVFITLNKKKIKRKRRRSLKPVTGVL
jgi:hypothetical protein